MKITIISFSGRADGNCSKVSSMIKEHYKNQAKIYKFSDFSINSCGNSCNNECISNKICPHKNDMEEKLIKEISESDVSYFVVPNYSDYPCSNFFIFNERFLSCTWNNEKLLEKYTKSTKKFIVISSSSSENFEKVFSYHCENKAEIKFISPKELQK